jgi:cation/acetate symporter
LVLSVWWKRLNAWGAMVGMVAGLGMAAAAILLGEAGAWPLPGVLAAVLGLPAGAGAAIVASVLAPHPRRSIIDAVHEMRVPGGETLYDREVRLKRLKSPTPA